MSDHTPSTALRVGDAERAVAVEELARHHADGRLDLAEFDQRAAAAWRARTRAELAAPFADLPDAPDTPAPAPPAPPGRPLVARDVGFAVHVAVYVLVVVGLWVVWLTTGGGHPWPVYPMFGWGSGLAGHALVARHCTGVDGLRPC